MKRDTKPEDSIAEVGDTIESSVNWDIPNPFTQHKKEEGFFYYYAVDRQGIGGTVAELQTHGYEIDTSQKSAAPGHVLMRIPIAKKQARERGEKNRQRLMEAGSIGTDGKFDQPVEIGRHDAGYQGRK